MPPLYLNILLLLGSAGAIYFASEYFVNGVEWVGHKLDLGQKATGTLLAAFGTALPESVVTLVAVAFNADPAQKDIGVGAAGTYRLADEADLAAYLGEVPPVDHMVEEVIEGRLVTYDGLADRDGRVVFDSTLTYATSVLDVVQGGDRIEDEVETAGVFVHLFGIAREDYLMCAEAECVVNLGGRSRENHHVRTEGPGEFNPHVAEATETHDADFLAWADFPMAQRGIGRDAGAEQRGDSGEWKIRWNTEDEVLVHDDTFRIAAISGQTEVFVSPAICPNLGWRKLLIARTTVRAGHVGIHKTADPDKITGFEFSYV